MNDNQLEKLYGLLKDFSTAMLITVGGPDSCHARPMAIAKVDGNTDLWLFTSRDSEKVREIAADSRVQVHCQDGWTNCVVFAGRATVVEDRAMIRKIWKPSFKTWFPGGAEDPDIALLHITGEHAEYWDSTGANSFRYAYQSLKALVTGTKTEIKEGEQHGNVNLRK
jgi:general stress protein 26